MLIDRFSDSTLQVTFKKLPHIQFWYDIKEKYPQLSEKATKKFLFSECISFMRSNFSHTSTKLT